MQSVIVKPHSLDLKRVVTASRLQGFLSCQRRHYYRYVMGYSETKTSNAIYFGKIVHKGLEEFFKTKTPENISGDLTNAKAMMRLEAFNLIKDDEWLRDSLLDTANSLMDRYAKRWAGDGLVTLAVETEFLIPMSKLCEGFENLRLGEWYIAGKIDGVVIDTKTRCKYLVEHKTSAARIDPWSDYSDTLSFDYQVSMYMVAARALGWCIDGVIYDVLKNPTRARKTATPPEKWKTNKDGSLNKRIRTNDETLEEFSASMCKELDRENDSPFYRYSTSRDNNKLEEFIDEVLVDFCREVTRRENVINNNQNMAACKSHSHPCPFKLICAGNSFNSIDSLKQGDIFPELEFTKGAQCQNQ